MGQRRIDIKSIYAKLSCCTVVQHNSNERSGLSIVCSEYSDLSCPMSMCLIGLRDWDVQKSVSSSNLYRLNIREDA